MENYIFWSGIGSGFEEPAGTPPTKNSQEFPPGYSHRVMGSINGLFKKVPPGTFDIVICEKHMLSYLLNYKIGKEFWKKLIIKTYLSAEIIIYM